MPEITYEMLGTPCENPVPTGCSTHLLTVLGMHNYILDKTVTHSMLVYDDRHDGKNGTP